ncbi:MAG: CBS domain-containing protein [Kordiimonadaceae bacterium]|nr:CBS domain-containing protein [Kordiimonadaceae bacterium]
MNVAKILESKGSEIVSLEAGCSIMDVAKLLGTRRIGSIPIVAGTKLVGIISERDIVRGLAIKGTDVLVDPVDSLMSKTVFTCRKDDTVQHLMTIMTDRRIRHIPVMDGEKMIGMVSIGDLVKERMQEAEQEADALKEYIGSA